MRARIDVLSELAEAWGDRVRAWAERNRPHRTELGDGQVAPDPNDEYLLYQTLVGAWPADFATPAGRHDFAERVRADAGDDVTRQIARVYELAFGRGPREEERALAERFVREFGLEQMCVAVFNANELLFVD